MAPELPSLKVCQYAATALAPGAKEAREVGVDVRHPCLDEISEIQNSILDLGMYMSS